jgi:hypothetical protein
VTTDGRFAINACRSFYWEFPLRMYELASAPLMRQLDAVEREVVTNLNTFLARIPAVEQDRSGSPK